MEMNQETRISTSLKEKLSEALKGFSGESYWHAPLSPYTSLKVGGPADLLVFPKSVSDLALLIPLLADHPLPIFVMGNGSNLLVKDGGIAGVVIHLKHLNQMKQIEANHLFAESGASYPKLALFAMDHGLSGLEFASGIPGSVGGAVAMNAGIPAYETAQVLSRISVMDFSGRVQNFSAQDLIFSYRKTKWPKGLILSANFVLRPNPRRLIEAKMKHFLKRRQTTQPLQKPNCGSVFKNPSGHHAGALIEAAELKGFSIGDAQISEQHGNFILNHGQATAQDCLTLIAKIKEKVRQETGIALELEVKIIGRDVL